MSTNENPSWIRQIASLNQIELAQMEDQFPLIGIDENYVFDLAEWMKLEAWKSNTMPPLKKREQAILAESIGLHGVLKDVIVDTNDGWVADGNNRLQIYGKARSDGLKIPFAGFAVRHFASEEEREAFQATLSFAGRLPSRQMMRDAARRAIKHHLNWADNRIAKEIGIDQETVTSVSDEMVAKGEIDQRPEMREGRDGVFRKAPKPKQRTNEDSPDPADALWNAWHFERGGHGTTSDDVVNIAKSLQIDLATCGVKTPREETERAIKLSVSNWLSSLVGTRVGGKHLTAKRADNGYTVYSLLAKKDCRQELLAACRTLSPNFAV